MSARHARPVLTLAAARAEVAAAEAIFTQMGDVMAAAAAPVAVVAPTTRTRPARKAVTRKAVTRTAAPKRVTPEAPVHERAFAEDEITLSAYRGMVARRMVALATPAGLDRKTVVRTHWDARAIVKSYTNGRHPFVVGTALVYGDQL